MRINGGLEEVVFTAVAGACPRQPDGTSCGYFALTVLDALVVTACTADEWAYDKFAEIKSFPCQLRQGVSKLFAGVNGLLMRRRVSLHHWRPWGARGGPLFRPLVPLT